MCQLDFEAYDKRWKEMRQEVIEVQAWLEEDKESQIRKRVLIKTYVSSIESAVNMISHAIFTSIANELNPGEADALSETQYGIDAQGQIVENTRFNRLLSRWRLVVNIMECRIGSDHWRIDFGNHGFECLAFLIETRNTLTHPKIENDIHISDENMQTCIDGHQWFIENHQGICKI